MSSNRQAIFNDVSQNSFVKTKQDGSPIHVYKENTKNHISFNVMPGMQVEETLFIKEYRILEDGIEAVFDRKYFTLMAKSPNHLIFVTALVHLQKMLYVYMCHRLGLKYNPLGPEKLKIWPTSLNIEMPKLVTKKSDIVHKIKISEVTKTGPKSYYITATSDVEGTIEINGEAAVFLM
ncbi:MAG: hypothetical protein ISR90_03005 [Candidatus Marinimicrobia bacterium]|nr:hypothetical protein [Candidatus Neomarinimicrobiota bacterium]MBL7023009.1 hypothetical protein [Candidatus Neomarinimicrobiota bacterium]MBL7109649.1 hypothetical protein [Candidatus Neomarinimicrobiota bacterium]